MVDLDNAVSSPEAEGGLYSISVDEFLGPAPMNPQLYNARDPSQRVTRDTFMSMWTDSFGKSRGRESPQYLFLEWLMSNNGHDYRTSLGNLSEAGGWECLSREEQNMFVSAVSRVSSHKVELGTPQDPHYVKGIIIEFQEVVDIFASPESYEKKYEFPYKLASLVPTDEPLNGMSLQRLSQIINIDYRKRKSGIKL